MTKANSGDSRSISRNTSSGPKTYSITDLEKRAERLLEAAFPTGLTPPVDIEYIAEREIGLEIVPVPGLERSYGTLGSLWQTKEGGHKVIVDQEMMDDRVNRYRFTLGEEVAHYVLHREHFTETETVKQACAVQQELEADLHHMERNAKRFSAALLMPVDAVRGRANTIYATIVGHVGFGNAAAVRNKLTALLAQQFRVSAQAMRIRLQNYACGVTEALDRALAGHHADLWETNR